MPPCPYALPHFMRPMGLHATEQLEGRTLLLVTASAVSTCLMLVWHDLPSCAQTSPDADPSRTLEAANLSAPQVFASTKHAHLPARVSGCPCEHKEPLFLSSQGRGDVFQEPSFFNSCFVQDISRKYHLRRHFTKIPINHA